MIEKKEESGLMIKKGDFDNNRDYTVYILRELKYDFK